MHRRVDLSSRWISSQYFQSDFEPGFWARENEHILSPFESEFRVGISSHAQDLSSISSQDFESSVAGFRRSCHGRLLNPSLGGALRRNNAGDFVTKITTKERDDSMVKFREYIWSAYLAFLFVFNETETLTLFKGETNEN